MHIIISEGNVKLNNIKSEKSSVLFDSNIMLDSTIDITKTDQISFIVRYVNLNRDSKEIITEVKIEESFLGFTVADGYKADEMVNTIFSILENHNLCIEKMRGQGYDGAPNMSGVYGGVQKQNSRKTTKCSIHPRK